MNISNMELQELKRLKREIENEIEEREEMELREFKELIKSYLGATHRPSITDTQPSATDVSGSLVGTEELAERLGVARSQIYRLTFSGKIPVIKVGKYNRYDYEEVVAALNRLNGKA